MGGYPVQGHGPTGTEKPCSWADINQPYQLAYWKQRFGVSDQELEDAVHAVGTSVKKIEAYLKTKGS